MKLIIEKLHNGYLLTLQNEEKIVIEEDFDVNDDTDECHRQLLLNVLEMLEIYGSKHNSRRLIVEWEEKND